MDEEKELLDKFNGKDRDAYEVIFKRYYEKLMKKAYYRLRNEDKSKDAVADCFVKLWNSDAIFEVFAELESYLQDTIKTVCIDMWRKEKKRSREMSTDLDQFEMLEGENDGIARKILLKAVRDEIEQFPPRCRQIFKMKHFEDLDVKEISKELNLETSTIYTQLEIGRNLLKKKFPGITFAIMPWIINLLLQNILWALLFVNTQRVIPPVKVSSNNKLLII